MRPRTGALFAFVFAIACTCLIERLRARGMRFVTVTKLLGGAMRYR